MKRPLLFVYVGLMFCALNAWGQPKDYTINSSQGTISLQVTKNYLSRSMMMTGLPGIYPHYVYGCPTNGDAEKHAQERLLFKRCVAVTRPKMIMGINCWTGAQYTIEGANNFFLNCRDIADDIHQIDSEIIVGASLDEVIDVHIGAPNILPGATILPNGTSIQASPDGIAPLLAEYNSYLAKVNSDHPEYGFVSAITADSAHANNGDHFDYDKIAKDPIIGPSGQLVYSEYVDITKDQAQLWYFYLAKSYIDNGYEMLRLGQILVTASDDVNFKKTYQLVQVIRAYAKLHARRKIVLLEQQASSTYFQTSSGPKCIFDICGLPIRLYSTKEVAQENSLVDDCGTLRPAFPQLHDYDVTTAPTTGDPEWMHCQGGQTYYWASVSKLPAYIELDNTGDQPWATVNSNAHPPTPNATPTTGGFPWGWDECSWFYHQSVGYEKRWMAMLYAEVRCLTNGDVTFCMPGRRVYNFEDAQGAHQGIFNVFGCLTGSSSTTACTGLLVDDSHVYPTPSEDSKPLASTIASIWAADESYAFLPYNSGVPSLQQNPTTSLVRTAHPPFTPRNAVFTKLNNDGMLGVVHSNCTTNKMDICLSNSANQLSYSGYRLSGIKFPERAVPSAVVTFPVGPGIVVGPTLTSFICTPPPRMLNACKPLWTQRAWAPGTSTP